MEEDEDRAVAANSEIRFIALELMKLAQKSGRSFDEVAAEYMKNAEKLSDMITGEEIAPVKKATRASSKEK
jgi:hypothetical protein